MDKVKIPERLLPLVKAFSTNEESAKSLIIDAAKVLYSPKNALTGEEIEIVVNLMKEIAPQDTIEMIYGAEIITGYLKGLRFLSYSYPSDQKLGLKLLRFSNEMLLSLQNKRSQKG